MLDKTRIDRISSFIRFVELYHRHDVRGLENFPREGGVLLALNHSFATYDITLLQNKIYRNIKRTSRALADRWFFKNVKIAEFMKSIGAIEGSPDDAVELLKSGEIVCVAPGGMREALRPTSERYQVLWSKRKGFAKVAYLSGAPVVLAACPKADDIYELYPNLVTPWAYKTFKIPLPLLRGLAFTPFPRPVRLTHFLSEPIFPPALKSDPTQQLEDISNFHKTLVKRMRDLIADAVVTPEKERNSSE